MVYVITGGPGFGKSVLVERLKDLGFRVSDEIARQVISRQLAIQGDILPWKNGDLFEKMVMDERMKFLKQSAEVEIGFSDRGLPDQEAYSRYKGRITSERLMQTIQSNRYANRVFITPPWREIYHNDHVRTESFEEAKQIHDCIEEVYLDHGYTLIHLPLVSIYERINFILNLL